MRAEEELRTVFSPRNTDIQEEEKALCPKKCGCHSRGWKCYANRVNAVQMHIDRLMACSESIGEYDNTFFRHTITTNDRSIGFANYE